MPTLPSSSTFMIDTGGRSARVLRSLVVREIAPGVYALAAEGDADFETVETSPGVFELVAVGAYPGANRLVSRQLGTGPIIVY